MGNVRVNVGGTLRRGNGRSAEVLVVEEAHRFPGAMGCVTVVGVNGQRDFLFAKRMTDTSDGRWGSKRVSFFDGTVR